MARRKKQAESDTITLDAPPVLGVSPLLDQVIENTPAVKAKPEIPEGFEVLHEAVWYMRINKDYLTGKSEKPVQLYQASKAIGCECRMCQSYAQSGDESESQPIPFQDVKVLAGGMEVVYSQLRGCGGLSASVRLRTTPGSLVCVKR